MPSGTHGERTNCLFADGLIVACCA
ncbi:hypothetical protein KVP90_19195 [Escherichia coli]|nr:hypothetical protein [Escherichia coli]